MANIAFSEKTGITRDLLLQLKPQRKRYFLVFNDPRLRPPVLDEMMPDIQKVIATVAKTYCDTTSPHLQFDDLTSEGNVKLAELLTKNQLDRQTSRYDFFRYFKATVNNHIKSRVQKYRFTEKRTGQKPPPREQRFKPAAEVEDTEDGEHSEHKHAVEQEPVAYKKNVDLSLDDPDSGLQVSDTHDQTETEEQDITWGFSSVSSDYAYDFSPVEKLVFHEMIAPGAHARCYAEMDAMRKSNKGKVSIKIKFTHMAQAIGISDELFEEAVLSIRTKTKAHCMLTEDEQVNKSRNSATIAQLKQVFGLQIPSDIDNMVVRRMLTMAARDQFDKLNQDLKEMLCEVGAKVPHLIGGNKIACYGVLFQKNCRVCNSCDLKHSCSVEANNLGLVDLVFNPKLLGARQTRVPSFLPRIAGETKPVNVSDPAAETEELLTSVNPSNEASDIIAHLNSTFQVADRIGQVFYYHNIGEEKKRRYLFCVERVNPLCLRFCKPSSSLKKRLIGKQKTWFASETATMEELMSLIEQHSKETFE